MFKVGVFSNPTRDRFERILRGGGERHLAKHGPMVTNTRRKKGFWLVDLDIKTHRDLRPTGRANVKVIYGVKVPASMIIMCVMVMFNPSEKV